MFNSIEMKLYTKDQKPIIIIFTLLISLTLTILNFILFLTSKNFSERLFFLLGCITFISISFGAHLWGQKHYTAKKNANNDKLS
ncbi:MAG: hypothetical protein EAX86_02390 [Candidatus Heimdallarchaeota archaeon]|nr:hypothetical protein [Candidatus Heimdallarchaeota archaeon]